MRCFQIFQNISNETALKLIAFFREEENDSYKGTLLNLAQQKRLRPVFVQRKSKPDQAAWMIKSLSTLPADGLAEHLLQVWLLRQHKEMLIQFLDGVEIEHDGEGSVENLPEELDEAKVKSVTDALLSKYEREDVAIYLHVFNRQVPDGWPALSGIIEEDSRVKLPLGEADKAKAQPSDSGSNSEEE